MRKISVDRYGDGQIGVIENQAFIAWLSVDRYGDGVITSSVGSSSVLRREGAVILGIDDAGNGTVSTITASGARTLLGTDGAGNAGLIVGSGSETGAGAVILGVDQAGNGAMNVVSASGSIAGLGVDEAGDASVLVTNKEGILTSVLGVDENGHGVMGILNASGRPIAAMAADESGNGVLGIEDGKFFAHVDSVGNGVAETRGQNEIIRWSSEMAPAGGGGGTPSGLIGDLDQDGDVDFNDFLIFTSNFGKTSG